MAVLAPMPSAKDKMAVAAKAGFRNKLRRASFIGGDSTQLYHQIVSLKRKALRDGLGGYCSRVK
jgi:hypothetical protein